jgi:hypothetical protein
MRPDAAPIQDWSAYAFVMRCWALKMVASLGRWLSRDVAVRSTVEDRRARRAVPLPTVQCLESREVRSAMAGLSPPRAEPAAVSPANVVEPVEGHATNTGGFEPMFNGTNTAGWFIPYQWGKAIAKNGQILLTGDKDFFLVSRNTYSNFILEADVLIPSQGNSGLQFRSRYGLNSINGYQADVDTEARNWAGGLWTQSRGWLARPAHRAPVAPGHWNHYEVEATGNHIEILVNGTVTVDTYNNAFTDGHIALQDHGTKGAVYHFKNVEIENLGG